MSVNRQVNIDMNFRANMNDVNSQINQLRTSLSNIITSNSFKSNLTPELRNATNAAKDLQIHLTKAMNPQTGQLDLSKFNLSLKQSNQSVQQLSQSLLQGGKQGQQAFTQLANSIVSAQAPMRTTNELMTRFMTTLKNTARYQIGANMLMGFTKAVRDAFEYTKELNTNLNAIRVVTGDTAEEMDRFAVQANKVAKELGRGTNDIVKATLIYRQQGDTAEAAMKKAEITTKAANISFNSSAEEMSEYLTAIWNSYQVGEEQLESFVDKIAAVGAGTATSMEELATAMTKVAATANTVGVNFDQLTATISTVSSVTRTSAETVGTAFKTIYARMGDLKLGEALDDGVTLGTVSSTLEKVGIQILDTQGNMRDMGIVVEELGEKWQTMTSAQKQSIAQAVAGKRQYTQLMALFENWDMYKNAIGLSENSLGTLQEQQDIYVQSWDAASKKVQASLESIYTKIFDDDMFIDMTNALGSLVEGLDFLIDSMGGFGNLLLMTGAIFLNKFSTPAAQGLQNLKNNFLIAIGAGAKLDAQTREHIANELKRAKTLDITDEAMKQHYTNLERTLTLQVKYNNSVKNMTEMDKLAAQAEMELFEKQQKRLETLAKSVGQYKTGKNFTSSIIGADEEGDSAWLNQSTGDTSILNTDRFANQTDLKNIQFAPGELAFGNVEISNMEELFTTVQKVEGAFVDVREAQEQLENASEDMPLDVKKLEQAYDALKGPLTENHDLLKLIQQAIEDGTVDVNELKTAYQKATVEADEFYKKTRGKSVSTTNKRGQTIQTNIQGITDDVVSEIVIGEENVRDLARGNAEAEDRMKSFEEQIKKTGAGLEKWSTNLVTAGSALMSLTSAINSIRGIVSIWTDEDLEPGEKFLQILQQMPMLIMEVGMLLNTLKGTEALTWIMKLGMGFNSLFPAGLAAKLGGEAAGAGATAAATGFSALWAALGPITVALIAIAAVAGAVITVLDKFVFTQDESREKVEKNTKALEEQTKKVQELETELNNLKNKLSELQAKDSLSIVDKADIANLEKEIELQEQLLEQEKKIQAEKNKETYNSRIESSQDTSGGKTAIISKTEYKGSSDNFENNLTNIIKMLGLDTDGMGNHQEIDMNKLSREQQDLISSIGAEAKDTAYTSRGTGIYYDTKTGKYMFDPFEYSNSSAEERRIMSGDNVEFKSEKKYSFGAEISDETKETLKSGSSADKKSAALKEQKEFVDEVLNNALLYGEDLANEKFDQYYKDLGVIWASAYSDDPEGLFRVRVTPILKEMSTEEWKEFKSSTEGRLAGKNITEENAGTVEIWGSQDAANNAKRLAREQGVSVYELALMMESLDAKKNELKNKKGIDVSNLTKDQELILAMLDDSTLSTIDDIDELNVILERNTGLLKNNIGSTSEYLKTLDNYTKSVKSANDALVEVQKEGKLSYKTLSSLEETFGNVEGAREILDKLWMADSVEEYEAALQELASKINLVTVNTDLLKGSTKAENEALIAQTAAAYKNVGAANAYELALNSVGKAHMEKAFAEKKSIEDIKLLGQAYGFTEEQIEGYVEQLNISKQIESFTNFQQLINELNLLGDQAELTGYQLLLLKKFTDLGWITKDGQINWDVMNTLQYTDVLAEMAKINQEWQDSLGLNAEIEIQGLTDEERLKKQKELNEKYAKDRLERLKAELEKRKALIEKYDSQIEVLDWAEELLDEQDYTGKLDVVNQKFETSKSKAEELINEYNRVKDIQATTGDEMTEVANRMEELGEEIRENISDMREYANQIYLTAAQSISTIVEGRTDAFDKLFSRIESRIQALKGESDTIGKGLLTANSEINMLAYLPVGATGLSEELEERKKEDRQLIAQAKETEEEIADIKIKAMEKVAAEAAAARAEEIAGLNKVKTEVKKAAVTTKEDAKEVEDYVKDTTVPNIQKELKKIGDTEIPTTGIDNFCDKVKEKITELVKAVSGELESDIFLTTISDNLNTKLDSIVAMLKEAGYGVPMGESVDMTAFSDGSGHSITQGAKLFLGTPYKWGGTTNKGLDCSGLTWRVLRANGIPVDRTAAAQYSQNLGKAVSTGTMDLSQLQPGDSVFFKNTGGRTGITHVGIYVGNGKMIHAPSPGKTVQEQNLDTNYYREHWAGAKRYVNQYVDGGILPDEIASIYGEEGFEYAVLPNGRIKKIGKDGIGIGNFPPGTKIIPHEAAKDLIKNWGELDNTFVKQYAKGTGSTVSPNLDETNKNLEDIKKNTEETAKNTKDNKDKDIINVLKDKIPGFKEAYDITNQTEEHIKAQDAKIANYIAENKDVYTEDGQIAFARFIAKTEVETATSLKNSGDQILKEYFEAIKRGDMAYDSATFKEIQEVVQNADDYMETAGEYLSKSYEMSFSKFQIEANKQNEDIEYYSKFQNWAEGDSANVRINKLAEQMAADKAIFQADLDELLANNQIDQETYDNQMKTFVDKYMGEINKVLETSWAHSQEYIEKYKFDASKLTAANALAFFDRQDKELETLWDGVEKTAEYYAAKNKIAESREQYIKDLLKQSKTQYFEDWQKEIDATKRLHTERIALLTAENNLYTQRYDLDNKIREAQKTINKELKASMAMSAYLDEDTRKLLFNEEKYNTLSQKLLDIKNESYALDSQHRRNMQAIMNDENLSAEAKKARLEQITEEYNHQYSLLMKSYEIAQKELTVEEKRQALQNTLNNKNQMMFINGKWTNVADMEAVEKAQSDLIDAEYDVETAERDYAQTQLLRTNTRSITAMNTDDTVANAQLAEEQRQWEEMLDMLEPRVQDFDDLMADILSSGQGIAQLFTSDKWKGFFGAVAANSYASTTSSVNKEPEYITISAEELRQKNPELFNKLGIEGEGDITIEKIPDPMRDISGPNEEIAIQNESKELLSQVAEIENANSERLISMNEHILANGVTQEKIDEWFKQVTDYQNKQLEKLGDQRPNVIIQSVDIDYETAESDSFLNVIESVAPISEG